MPGRPERHLSYRPRMHSARRKRCAWFRVSQSGGFEQSELLQRSHTVVETDLFDYLAVLEFQNGGSGEMHLPTGRGGQRSD